MQRDPAKSLLPIGECAAWTQSSDEEFEAVADELGIVPVEWNLYVAWYTESEALAVSREIVNRLREQRDTLTAAST